MKKSKSNSKFFHAILRQDLVSFVKKSFHTINPGMIYLPNWHIVAICYHLQLCFEGKINRLIITIPPRHLKSIIASVAFIAWVLGRDPTRQIFCASYSQILSNKHSRDTRLVLESDWYRALFPFTQIDRNKNTESEFVTTQQGYRLATSVGGTLTGRGGNMLIIDDALKADDANSESALTTAIEWFTGTALSRLNNKVTDPIIVIQQRLHDKDLAGYLLETGKWVHLNIPAIAEEYQRIQISKDTFHIRRPGDILHPERESREILDGLKQSMGSYSFAAQYQQRPAPIEGGIVKWSWFHTYDKAPVKGDYDQIIQSWDTACKTESMHDYSVCTTWMIKSQKMYLLHVLRQRLDYPSLKKRIITYAKMKHANQILIEDMGAGTSLIQDLRSNTSLCITACNPTGDKVSRLMSVTALIESAQVLFPKKAYWLADFQHEVVTFPMGKHDDQIDSMSQFLEWARNRYKHTGPFEIITGPPSEIWSNDDLWLEY